MAHQPVRRPDRSAHQLAAAIGTMPAEHALRAVAAEGAFEGADAGIQRFGWQIPVAAFAIGPKFEHRYRSEKVATAERLSL
jgi:hypothetical protein